MVKIVNDMAETTLWLCDQRERVDLRHVYAIFRPPSLCFFESPWIQTSTGTTNLIGVFVAPVGRTYSITLPPV